MCCDWFDKNWFDKIMNLQYPRNKAYWKFLYGWPYQRPHWNKICMVLASCPLSNALCSVWDMHNSASQVPRPFWYANCVVGSTPLLSKNHPRQTNTHQTFKDLKPTVDAQTSIGGHLSVVDAPWSRWNWAELPHLFFCSEPFILEQRTLGIALVPQGTKQLISLMGSWPAQPDRSRQSNNNNTTLDNNYVMEIVE